MITLSNNYSFEFCVSSGALAFDGRGWPHEWPLRWFGLLDPQQFTIVAKTITYLPTKGNLKWHCPWQCINIFGKESVVNAVGLTNPGTEIWIKKHYPTAKRLGYNIVPSVKLEDRYNLKLDLLDIPYIEINASCPNSKYLEEWKMLRYIRKPIVLKLSYDQINPSFISKVDNLPNLEAYHAINTVPWNTLQWEKSPLSKYGLEGGVSGTLIHNLAINAVEKLSQITKKPIIGGGGIFSLEDVYDFQKAGAKAFSIGTCFLFHPTRPNKIVKEYYLKDKNNDNQNAEINKKFPN